MKTNTLAGLLALAGGLMLVAIWVYFLSYVILQGPADSSSRIDRVLEFLTGGANWQFFLISTVCALTGFLSAFLFLSGRYLKLAIVIVAINALAVSFMYAWFVVALMASPLLPAFWLLRQNGLRRWRPVRDGKPATSERSNP